MDISANTMNHYMTLYIWSFCRIAAVLMVAPIFSEHSVPATYRIFLSLALTVVTASTIQSVPSVDLLSGEGLMIMAQQILLGTAIGFIISIVFQSLIIGGQIIASQTGLAFANMMDPSHGGPISLISQLYMMIMILIFLSLNGHIQLLVLLSKSFSSLPIGLDNMDANKMQSIYLFSTEMFKGAVILSLPAIIALLIVNVAFGIMTRSAPQLNIISIGFPITLTFGIYVVYLSVSGIAPHCENLMESGFSQITKMITH